jgi:hypothetical protein
MKTLLVRAKELDIEKDFSQHQCTETGAIFGSMVCCSCPFYEGLTEGKNGTAFLCNNEKAPKMAQRDYQKHSGAKIFGNDDLNKLKDAGFKFIYPAVFGEVCAINQNNDTRITACINRNGLLIHVDNKLEPIASFESCTINSVIKLAQFLGCI